ncbi:MAG: c-type cytochrome, partial [Verrucomicrobia bacterium]|nr:c-type cytochrome [Verrucomicrobiota bacterium]
KLAESTLGKGRGKQVNLAKIAKQKGQVGKMSIEDVILALGKVKGNVGLGKKIFTQQGCFACHTTGVKEALKGPFMGHVGSILSRDQIAESILKPNASISQGFATVTVTTKDKKTYTGFISKSTANDMEIRDIAGKVTVLKTDQVKDKKELEISMMPPGLANALSIEEFASLISYLQSMKK